MVELKLCSGKSRLVLCIFTRCSEDMISELCSFPIKAEKKKKITCSSYNFFIILQYNVFCMKKLKNYDVENTECMG